MNVAALLLGPELTLGDVLAEALTRSDDDREMRLAAEAQFLSAKRICADVAPTLGVSQREVFDELATIHDNLLPLLHSPEGWSALAEYAALRLGRAVPPYAPTRH